MKNLAKVLVPVFVMGFFACGSKSSEPAITAGLKVQNQDGGTNLTDDKRTEIYNTSTGEYKSLRFFVLDEFGDTIKNEVENKSITFKGSVPFLRTILDAGKYNATLIIFQLEDYKGKSSKVVLPFTVVAGL